MFGNSKFTRFMKFSMVSLLGCIGGFLIVCLFGCAEPKYIKEDPNSHFNPSQQGDKANCAIQFNKSGDCLSWFWETRPTSSEAGSLVFKIFRANIYDHTPILIDAAVMPQLVLWMPDMGHGSSVTKVSQLDVGTYRAANVFFIMPGQWEMKFQIKEGNSVQDEVLVNFTF